MNRRQFLDAGAATALLSGLTGTAFAAEPLQQRLETLRHDLDRLMAREPAPLVQQALIANNLDPKAFSHLMAGLLVAHQWKDSTPEEQEDPAWKALMVETFPRFTEVYQKLLGKLAERPRNRAGRRLFRRPNRLARVVSLGLFGNAPAERVDALRRALSGLGDVDEDELVADAQHQFDAAWAAVQVRSKDGLWNAEPANDEEAWRLLWKRLGVAALLLLAIYPTFALGYAGVTSGVPVLPGLGLLLCVACVALLVLAMVRFIQALILYGRYKFGEDVALVDAVLALEPVPS